MHLERLIEYKTQIYEIAAKYHIKKVYVFGSTARGSSEDASDADFLIEMEEAASALGVGGFQYEVQNLLGIDIDVVPTFVLPGVEDRDFVKNIQADAIAL